MKPSLKNFDRPETKPGQFEDHEFTDNSDWEKARRKLKRKLALLITLFIALGAFLMTSCDDEPVPTGNPTLPTNPTTPTPSTSPMVIRSMFPTDGAPGSFVTIFLENFNHASTDHYVTFGPSPADIMHAGSGILAVRVPLELLNGSYEVTVRSNGHAATAPRAFEVIRGTKSSRF